MGVRMTVVPEVSLVLVEAYHVGDPAQADALLAPLRALGPINDTIGTVPSRR